MREEGRRKSKCKGLKSHCGIHLLKEQKISLCLEYSEQRGGEYDARWEGAYGKSQAWRAFGTIL